MHFEKRSFSSPGLRVVFGSFVDTKERKRVALPPFIDTKERNNKVLLVEPKRTKRLFAFRFFVVCVKSLAKSAAIAR